MGMGQILVIYVTHSSVHLVEEEPAFNMANLLLHPSPTPVLLKPPRLIKILFSEKPPSLIYQVTLTHRLVIFPFFHIFLLEEKVGHTNRVLWPVLSCSEFRKARAIKVNDADPFTYSWNALQGYHTIGYILFLKLFYLTQYNPKYYFNK